MTEVGTLLRGDLERELCELRGTALTIPQDQLAKGQKLSNQACSGAARADGDLHKLNDPANDDDHAPPGQCTNVYLILAARPQHHLCCSPAPSRRLVEASGGPRHGCGPGLQP